MSWRVRTTLPSRPGALAARAALAASCGEARVNILGLQIPSTEALRACRSAPVGWGSGAA
jgi:hypothetical protein